VAAGAPPHLLVTQLRFARDELVRGLEGVSEADGLRRLQPMNSIGWMVGHLANQEHRYWVVWAQRKDVAPGLPIEDRRPCWMTARPMARGAGGGRPRRRGFPSG
jgi:hypothetical protein